MTLTYRLVDSPIGPLTLVGEETRTVLRAILFARDPGLPATPPVRARLDAGAFPEAASQLTEYFAGKRRAFDLALEAEGTEFQRRVWQELSRIPYGETISYRELARRVGNPSAVRAVGGANGRNPLPIVIPCHRVIASDGSLAGFGGGLAAKQFLLRLEGVAIASPRDQILLGT